MCTGSNWIDGQSASLKNHFKGIFVEILIICHMNFSRLLLILLLIATGNQHSSAQAQFSPATKRFLFDLEEVRSSVMYKQSTSLPEDFVSSYGLYFKRGAYYIGVLCLVDPAIFNVQMFHQEGMVYSGAAGNVHSLRVPIERLSELARIPGVLLVDTGDPMSPDLKDSRKSTHADSVHMGLGGLDRAYTGKGVVIAVIDWGFDYTHPVFWDSTQTRYRVVRAWDQNKESGPAPDGFDFGTAYESMEELMRAEQDTLYVFGTMSHGTHVAGIAGGAAAGTEHMGIAPEADLIFVSLRRDAPSLLDAFLYIQRYARSVGKPFVVNMSFGSHLGAHDGSTPENLAIDALAGKGRIFVGSAGNNGDSPFHLFHAFSDSNEVLKTVVNFNPVDDYWGQTLSMWGSVYSSFEARILLVNESNQTVLSTPWYKSKEEPVLNETFAVSESDSLEIRITATAAFATNQKPNIRAELRKTGNLKTVLEIRSTDESEVHVWNNVRLRRRYTNWGVPLSATYPGARAGDIQYGLGEPAGTGRKVVTVASYRSERYLQNGTPILGQISSFSSWGPTTDGRRKPDIAGPGQNVISAVNSFDPNAGAAAEQISKDGKTYSFVAYSGTSMSGPAVCGIVALMLEQNPGLDQDQVQDILRKSRRLDLNTGDLADTGSLVWGMGKADAMRAMLITDEIPKTQLPQASAFSVFPNPGNESLNIRVYSGGILCIYSLNGQEMLNKEILETPKTDLSLDVKDYSNGMYFIHYQTKDEVFRSKWIKSSSMP